MSKARLVITAVVVEGSLHRLRSHAGLLAAADGELADRLSKLPKYVVFSTLTDPPWNATVMGVDWPEEVARLGNELDGEIVVYGSRRLSHALIGMGLVDQLRLLVYPVVLGARRSAVRRGRRTRSRCAWSNRVRPEEAW